MSTQTTVMSPTPKKCCEGDEWRQVKRSGCKHHIWYNRCKRVQDLAKPLELMTDDEQPTACGTRNCWKMLHNEAGVPYWYDACEDKQGIQKLYSKPRALMTKAERITSRRIKPWEKCVDEKTGDTFYWNNSTDEGSALDEVPEEVQDVLDLLEIERQEAEEARRAEQERRNASERLPLYSEVIDAPGNDGTGKVKAWASHCLEVDIAGFCKSLQSASKLVLSNAACENTYVDQGLHIDAFSNE
ncbi:hypothetical protein FKW77_001794 [Venturia effusa]|uniref:Uncharacterized protein n=1 Tax=Venturia effusa TaxID=50376 RepID=A0A517LEV6_9PEZI|nr:hypothetical protein FKW77_001794 [Venturia effusa]